jgi:hypothetical protein
MTAIKTQGTVFSVETALAATKAISGATAANPVVVTATAHGYTNGDIVKIANVVGMVQLNSRAFVVANITTNSFELKGVNGTNYSAYVSGGDSFKATMTAVGTVDGLPSLFTGTAPDIKTTHLLSVAEEKLQGLQDFGDVSVSMLLDDVDTGQIAMQDAKEAQAAKVFTILLVDTKKACFVGFVKSYQVTGPQNDVFRATSSISLQAAPARFA